MELQSVSFLIGIKMRNRRVLLHRQMRVAFVEESVFANQIGFGESFVHVAELERDFLVDVAAVAVFVNPRLVNHHAFFNRRDGLQRLVFDLDQIHRVERDVFVDGCDRGDRIADEAHLVDTERVLVLTDGQNAVRNRQDLCR